MGNPDIQIQFAVTNKIYWAIFIGQVLLFAAALFLVETLAADESNFSNDIFIYIVPGYGIVMMILSKIIYNMKIRNIIKNKDLVWKISEYRTAKIIVSAIIESAALFTIVIFMNKGNYYYAVVFILIAGYYLLNKPSRENFVMDIGLSDAEKSEILRGSKL